MDYSKLFISKSIKIHKNKYNYSKVEYINNKTKVEIICPIHGSFWQLPLNHVNNKGCRSCSVDEKKDYNFIKKADIIHKNKYNYSKVEYINSKIKVEIICPIHGSFFQSPNSHLKKHGCPSCSGNKIVTLSNFIKKADIIHKNKYDYSNTSYINNIKKVEIICPIHGSFFQKPGNHLSGKGCNRCSKINNTFDFISKSKDIHNSKYDYSKVNYISSLKKVEIICPIHGSFFQKPNYHLSGNGCQSCKSSKGELEIRKILLSNDIVFIQEKKFNDCKLKRELPFDFYLPEENVCIEFDGVQHFKPIGFFGGESALKKSKIRDKIKNEYCRTNNIKLIRIKFNENISSILEKSLTIKE